MHKLGPFLVYSAGAPVEWIYFDLKPVVCYTTAYPNESDNLVWTPRPLEDKELLYVYDVELQQPACIFVEEDQVYKISMTKAQKAGPVMRPLVTEEGDIIWIGSGGGKIASRYGVDIKQYPAQVEDALIVPNLVPVQAPEDLSEEGRALHEAPLDTFGKILQSINKITIPERASSLQAKIEICYGKQVLEWLMPVLDPENPDKVGPLEQCLHDNWSLVIGSPLCYTALPTSPITLLLCDIAQAVADEKNKQRAPGEPEFSAIQILMPNIALESRRLEIMPPEGCRARILCIPDESLSETDKGKVTDAKELLIIYDRAAKTFKIGFNDNGVYAEKSIDSELKNSRSARNLLNKFIKKGQHEVFLAKEIDIINTLIQSATIPTRIIPAGGGREGYADLNTLPNLKTVLKTHILGHDGLHLIPVRLMTELELSTVQKKLMNPYVSAEREAEAEAWYIEPDELLRLSKHSNLTKQLHSLHTRYVKLTGKDGGGTELYQQLSELCTELKKNSAHGGIGTGENAAFGAYPAIIKFNDFYRTLNEDDKKDIPPELRHEIDLLLNLSSDVNQNRNATENIQTCIGLRSEALVRAAAGSESLLNPAAFAQRVKNIQVEFLNAQTRLESYLTTGWTMGGYNPLDLMGSSPEGHDVLNIKHQLLRKLGIFNILSIKNELNIKEIVTETALSTLGFVNIPTPIDEFKSLLHSLEPDLRTLFFDAMHDNWPSLVKSVEDFMALDGFFLPEQQQELFGLLKSHLLSMVSTGVHYKAIRAYLSADEQTDFLLVLKVKFPDAWADINHEQFINDIKKRVMTRVNEELKEAWMLHKQVDIDREVARYNVWWLATTGFSMTRAEKRTVKQMQAGIHQRFFDNNLSPHLTKIFSDQLEIMSAGAVMNRLFERHPWIKADPESALVDPFVLDVLKNRLLAELKPDYGLLTGALGAVNNALGTELQTSYSRWTDIPEAVLSANHFVWNPDINTDWLKQQVEGHPLSNAKDFYLNKALPLYPSLDQNLMSGRHTADHWLNWRLTRVDLLRLLVRLYPKEMRSHAVDGVLCTQMAPKNTDELKHLSVEQLNYFKTLLVNTGTEDTPLWIVLHQDEHHQWTAYIPLLVVDDPIYLQCQAGLAVIRETMTILREEQVNYEMNARLNDVDMLDPVVQWHAVLVGRVLPACQQMLPVATFRKSVPVPVILQQVFLDSLQHVESLKQSVASAFVLRKPVTHYSAPELMPLPLKAVSSGLHVFSSHIEASQTERILSCFDSQVFILERGQSALRITSDVATPEEMKDALDLIYHNPISRLIFTPVSRLTFTPSVDLISLSSGFDTDVHLQSIESVLPLEAGNLLFNHATSCAARNRFLRAINPACFDGSHYDGSARKGLWLDTGAALAGFFQNQPACDLNSFEAIRELNRDWVQGHCDHENHAQFSDAQWAWVQVAQMGILGIESLFNSLRTTRVGQWNPDYKEPAPKLNCTLDLRGNASTNHPVAYMQRLTALITDYDSGESEPRALASGIPLPDGRGSDFSGKRGCAPLFASLSLILPKPLTTDSTQALLTLLDVLHKRKVNAPSESDEVLLYDLDINDPLLPTLHEQLDMRAQAGLNVVIRVPLWDKTVEGEDNRLTLTSYRLVQNKIRDNQRTLQAQVLPEQMQSVEQFVNDTLKPQIIVKNKHNNLEQTWIGDEIWYPLTAQTPGIQQQQEQEQEQQQEQQQEQEVDQEQRSDAEAEPEPDPEPEMRPETALVSRLTIDDYCTRHWPDADVSRLFSLWTGSDVDAVRVIEKIEESAVQKIMQHVGQFRFGVNQGHLPAGFFLARSMVTQGLILCFDPEREKQERLTLSQLDPKLRDPFKMELYEPLSRTLFRGDFRQLEAFCSDAHDMEVMWNYLTTDDEERSLVKEETTYLRVLQNLREWAKQSGASDALVCILFDANHDACMTEQNLKAFGQLFNQYDARAITPSGTQDWLMLSENILNVFGPQHFATWKKRVLDPSVNWTECLDKTEVDAIALSLVTLKHTPLEQNIWWALVDAQGAASESLRYAPLWSAFQASLNYLEHHKLHFDESSLSRFLKKTPDFNAQVFLDRLSFVLQNMNNEINGHDCAQNVLNNLDKIDWRYNGFYYASRYAGYHYWHEHFDLTQLNSTVQDNPLSYHARWLVDDVINDPMTHTLRFASQRTRLSIYELQQLETLLNTAVYDRPETMLSLRTFSACLALGVDKVERLDGLSMADDLSAVAKSNPDLLRWLNSQFNLDGNLQSKQFELHWADVAEFIRAVEQVDGLSARVLALRGDDARGFINACGRALQCYRYVPETTGESEPRALASGIPLPDGRGSDSSGETMTEAKYSLVDLLGFVHSKQQLDHPLLTDYPWLIASYDANNDPAARYAGQKDMLQKQLRSIDFSQSRYLPNQVDMNQVFSQIDQSENPVQARRDMMSSWIDKGCAITVQDAAFRQLNTDEIHHAMDYFERHLELNFKSENMSLCKRFFENYLAVETEGEYTLQLKQMYEWLNRLDNKVHYNELGQILGLLINQANQVPKRYYSAPQLCTWIDSFMDEKTCGQRHYPVSLLTELLSSPMPTLLNQNLNALKEPIESPELVVIMQEVAASLLANQDKRALVKLALQPEVDLSYVSQSLGGLMNLSQFDWLERDYKDSCCRYLAKLDPTVRKEWAWVPFSATDVTNKPSWFKALWQRSQIKLMNSLLNQPELSGNLVTYPSTKELYIRTILLTASPNGNLDCLSGSQRDLLEKWTEDELSKLAQYFATEPHPSLDTLDLLLKDPSIAIKNPRTWKSFASKPEDFKPITLTYNNQKAVDLIHHFETVIQARDKDGQSKRHYSVTENDREQLLRVLGGMKRKGQGYIADVEQKQLLNLLFYGNAYTQVAQLDSLSMPQLLGLVGAARMDLQGTSDAASDDARHQAAARLLVCMREILLRKTGKWANHTQMLDLLYAAIHNDESILHQLRTGQGKSILTVMRTAYLALNGAVVDVFSAKDSLSKRDWEEFAPVLNAMNIPNSYITATSKPDTYNATVKQGVGGVNYATLGNFSLFHSNLAWKGEVSINLDPKHRVAFLDEADHLLMDEQTQFNYSDNGGEVGIYNLDEWVYRAAYDFYLKHKDEFPHDKGVIRVSNQGHLKALCEYLQSQSASSPARSRFLERYIIPALEHDPQAMSQRDNQLRQLLAASHTAYHLKEGVEYCIRPETRVASDTVIETRFAKVLIDNQIRDGSTYSDLVHQFLHVRLNKEAANKGEKPDFFVDPVSQVVLSQNASYILKHDYHKLEGCTGTAGNHADLQHYAREYGITQVIKLPTHEERRTDFLPMKYCNTEASQIAAIVQQIIHFRDRPMLITCKDDIAVKRISKLVHESLAKQDPSFNLTDITTDTNDSGKAEQEIVPYAGRAGAITISSRMGRGTDIKPKTEAGLMVVRTFPTQPRVAKQELGRQGRNGARGTCLDIINYDAVDQEYVGYLQTSEKRLIEIMTEQAQHLHQKLDKHQRKGSKPSQLFEDDEVMDRYLVTRSIEQLKHEINEEKNMYTLYKNGVIAALVGKVEDVLNKYILTDNVKHKALKEKWPKVLEQINELWDQRLTGNAQDSDVVYNAFLDKVKGVWKTLCDDEPLLDSSLVGSTSRDLHVLKLPVDDTDTQAADTTVIVDFYQWWISGAQAAYFALDSGANSDTVNAIYGPKGLGDLFSALISIHSGDVRFLPQRSQLFACLKGVMDYQAGFVVNLENFAKSISLLEKKFDPADDFPKYLACFSHFFTQGWLNNTRAKEPLPEDIKKNSLLLTMITRIITKQEIQSDEQTVALCEFVTNMSEVIHDDCWDTFDEAMVARIESVFAVDKKVTALLTLNCEKAALISMVRDINLSSVLPDDVEGKKRRESLVKWLNQQVTGLANNPSVITHAFHLSLAGRQSPELIEALPAPNCVAKTDNHSNAMFWLFLSKRTPFTQDDTNSMTKFLSTYEKKDIDNIISKLYLLPPYVSLSYINKQLADKSGIPACERCIESIDNAGKRLCEFMLDQQLVTPEFQHPNLDTLASYDHVMTSFNAMTPDRNAIFFKTAHNYFNHNIDLERFKKLAVSFSKHKKLVETQLTAMCDLAELIKSLPKDSQSKILDEYDCLLTTDAEQLGDRHGRFAQFVTQLKDTDISGMPGTTTNALWLAWKDKRIDTRDHLNQSIEVVKMAMKLKDDNNFDITWVGCFGHHPTDEQNKQRQAIMQHLEHGLLDLGPDFKHRCEKEFKTYADETLGTSEPKTSLAGLGLKTRYQRLLDPLKSVIQLLQDIRIIASNPYNPDAATTKRGGDGAPGAYQSYFNEQKKRYDSYWWKIKEREEQSRSLFSGLLRVDGLVNKAQRYEAMLNAISTTQQALLTQENGTYRVGLDFYYLGFDLTQSTLNKRGFSRLYDISTQMHVKVMRDYLQDPAIDAKRKADFCEPLLKQQLKEHADKLCDKLDANHALRIALSAERDKVFLPGTNEFQKLKDVVTKPGFVNTIPKHLRYLIRPIQVACEVSPEGKTATSTNGGARRGG